MKKQSRGDSENQTTWLILEGFGELQHLGFLPFTLFLLIYVVTVGGNTLILLAVASTRTLHTPMYFFLCPFSLLEIGIPPTSCLGCCGASWKGGKPSRWSAVCSSSTCLPHWLQLSASYCLSCPLTVTWPSATPFTTLP